LLVAALRRPCFVGGGATPPVFFVGGGTAPPVFFVGGGTAPPRVPTFCV